MADKQKALAIEIAKIIDNKKGIDIKILDISVFSSYAEFFVIATGTSTKHTIALADEVYKKMSEKEVFLKHKEGYNKGNWVLLDFLDIVVHIFTEEEREFYDLERIWKGAKYIELDIDTF